MGGILLTLLPDKALVICGKEAAVSVQLCWTEHTYLNKTL